MDPSTPSLIEDCPLCFGTSTEYYHQDKHRLYAHCLRCHLVFVPASQHLPAAAEKAIYDLHQNNPEDAGYRRFLSRLTQPLSRYLKHGDNGLDFGCGPASAIPLLLPGQAMQRYDPIYFNNTALLNQQYDFITCTEVVEHFRQPRQEFQRLFSLLKADGHLGIMTKMVISPAAFARWHYKNDLTHIAFFSRECFLWLASQYHKQISFYGNDVVIFAAE